MFELPRDESQAQKGPPWRRAGDRAGRRSGPLSVGISASDYIDDHDHEWGRPVRGDDEAFE
ncbi:DNA-3-methyladenine glycosylase I [Spongiactinospora gelatinilytica]|uniref:DNA-3-methyladenine glycosylase I n=1 Tax=Spongiactinospora gelatinilytica TaxID=2666298 RepID=UPI0011B9411D|nr:DNA-3-methyladenine glycosylase I [Spongiactinospora gelatinilytica]